MYYQLTGALRRRIIAELRRYWQYHPEYTELPEHIQGKFSYKERPQQAIIVKTAGATHVALSADNFQGTLKTYAQLTKRKQYPGLSIEWIRDDSLAIKANAGRFPSPAGVYYLEVRNVVKCGGEGGEITESAELYVDPILDVPDETVMMVTSTEGQLQSSFIDGSLRLYLMPGNTPLYQETTERPGDYTADPATGAIVFNRPISQGQFISADYKVLGESTGPWPIYPNRSTNLPIPGVILAFGRRISEGDQMAVVVSDIRIPQVLEFGGRWDVSFDCDVMARDEEDMTDIADQTVIYLMGILRNRLSSEGVEIMSVDLGGESEEMYDDNADDYFYNSTFSMTVQADWAIHVPVVGQLRRIQPQRVDEAIEQSGLSDEDAALIQSNLRLVESLDLEVVDDPFFSRRTESFELIL